jgi:hypothetical protein
MNGSETFAQKQKLLLIISFHTPSIRPLTCKENTARGFETTGGHFIGYRVRKTGFLLALQGSLCGYR